MKQKWTKTRSGLLVPRRAWYVRALIEFDDLLLGDIPRWHFWDQGTGSFTRFFEKATTYLTKKAAETVAFALAVKYPHKVGEIEVVSKLVGEVFAEDQDDRR